MHLDLRQSSTISEVQDRLCGPFRATTMGDLRIQACKLGTDLTPAVKGECAPQAGESWQETVRRLLDQQAQRHEESPQSHLQKAPAEPSELFLRQYDLGAYEPRGRKDS